MGAAFQGETDQGITLFYLECDPESSGSWYMERRFFVGLRDQDFTLRSRL